jgi:hypothetical protein
MDRNYTQANGQLHFLISARTTVSADGCALIGMISVKKASLLIGRHYRPPGSNPPEREVAYGDLGPNGVRRRVAQILDGGHDMRQYR